MNLQKEIEQIKKHIKLTTTQHIQVDLEKFTFLVADSREAAYEPPPTGLKLHQDNSLVRLIIGPYGSGKSTSCCAEIIFRTCGMPPCIDGVRRARWAIVRNTYADLEATILKTWNEWFGELGIVSHKMSPRIYYHHTFNDGHGMIELEVMFIALDRPDHYSLRKLKSLEVTGVYLNELCELSELGLANFQGRIRRYPAKRMCKHKYFAGIIADTNPPPPDHWLYRKFETDRPAGFVIFHQPPAVLPSDEAECGYIINPEAENLKNYTDGERYYLDMIAGQTDEFIKVYAMGQYGMVSMNKAVFPSYNDNLHSKNKIEINRDIPIRIRVDYGVVCPAALISQFYDGRLFVLKEFIGEYMSISDLFEHSVEPWLNKNCGKDENGKAMVVETVLGDPANTDNGLEQLQERGYIVEAALTNDIERRISAVRYFLGLLVPGGPKILISREGCPKLREGMLGRYSYKRLKVVGEERYRDVPDKIHPTSDIHDCLQYDALDAKELDFLQEEEEEEKFDFQEYYDQKYRDDTTGY
jgi:hypothetical protein